jgi:hypothetical protein
MAGGPTPQTRFEAWPQALIGITNTRPGYITSNLKKGLLALIMISDIKEEWAAWYYFTSDYTLDIQLLKNYSSEVLAEKPKLPSHFTTRSPMRVGELCGATTFASPYVFRRAALVRVKHDVEDNHIEFLLGVQSGTVGWDR